MKYQAAVIYDSNGDFRGYGILSPAGKLKSTNLWADDERADLQAQIDRLNTDVALREYWPGIGDAEVYRLIQDPAFEPVDPSLGENEAAAAAQLRIRKAMETIARKRAALAT